ncbi:hypothetical protein [Paenibacillus taichungensis]|uniref:hypothetical protein n=1 Tax=Paenibacillus taichungensis TaxID=484184 RepID=UPI0038CF9228
MKRSELLQLVDFKIKEMSDYIQAYGDLVKANYMKILIFEQNILRFYAKVILNRNPNQIESNEQLGRSFNISIDTNGTTCTPHDFLVALRFFMRKIKSVRKVGEECQKNIKKKITLLETMAIELEGLPRGRKRDRMLNRLDSCILSGKGALAIKIPNNLDLPTTIQQLFNNAWQLENDALIQLITLKDGLINQDLLLKSIPDLINFPELYKLIVIDRIESINDCYLFDALNVIESKPS